MSRARSRTPTRQRRGSLAAAPPAPVALPPAPAPAAETVKLPSGMVRYFVDQIRRFAWYLPNADFDHNVDLLRELTPAMDYATDRNATLMRMYDSVDNRTGQPIRKYGVLARAIAFAAMFGAKAAMQGKEINPGVLLDLGLNVALNPAANYRLMMSAPAHIVETIAGSLNEAGAAGLSSIPVVGDVFSRVVQPAYRKLMDYLDPKSKEDVIPGGVLYFSLSMQKREAFHRNFVQGLIDVARGVDENAVQQQRLAPPAGEAQPGLLARATAYVSGLLPSAATASPAAAATLAIAAPDERQPQTGPIVASTQGDPVNQGDPINWQGTVLAPYSPVEQPVDIFHTAEMKQGFANTVSDILSSYDEWRRAFGYNPDSPDDGGAQVGSGCGCGDKRRYGGDARTSYIVSQQAYGKRRNVAPEGLQLLRKTDTAVAYRDPANGRVIIGIRGTTFDSPDVLTWPHVAFNQTRNTGRYDQARAFVEDVMKENPGARIELTGHSLGGTIALQLARDLGPRVHAVETFNPAPQPADLLLKDNATRYHMTGDPLYQVGWSAPGVQTFEGGDHELGSFAPHLGISAEDPFVYSGSDAAPSGIRPAAARLAANAADVLAHARLPGAARASNYLWSKYYGGKGRGKRSKRGGNGASRREKAARRDVALDIVNQNWFQRAERDAQRELQAADAALHSVPLGHPDKAKIWDAWRTGVLRSRDATGDRMDFEWGTR